MILADKIIENRKKNGWSQEELVQMGKRAGRAGYEKDPPVVGGVRSDHGLFDQG